MVPQTPSRPEEVTSVSKPGGHWSSESGGVPVLATVASGGDRFSSAEGKFASKKSTTLLSISYTHFM